MSAKDEETIYALSSGRGVAGVAVIRVSGPQADDVLRRISKKKELPEVRVASLRTLVSPFDYEVLDQAVVLRFQGPKSFTGEDVVELHCHGGSAVVDGILEVLNELGDSIRPAEAGEFTRRAYAAGKLGLTQVEGLADLLAASTQRQRRQAISILSGALERKYDAWRTILTELRAATEAAVDFGDDVEGDVAFDEIIGPTLDKAKTLRNDIQQSLARDSGFAIRDGVNIVLAGAPNAGKSSLLNAIAQRPAAIVSDTAGTTRDILEVALTLSGFPVRLYDTAGFREEAQDAIEEEGIRRAQTALLNAHLVCFVLDATTPDSTTPFDGLAPFLDYYTTPDQQQGNNNDNNKLPIPSLVFITNKCDLLLPHPPQDASLEEAKPLSKEEEEEKENSNIVDQEGRRRMLTTFLDAYFSNKEARDKTAAHILEEAPWLSTTATEHQGVDSLYTFLESFVQDRFARQQDTENDTPAIVRQRHKRHVLACLDHLERAIQDFPYAPELGAEGLRLASLELGRVVGLIDVEDVLDSLFSTFCIGK